MDYRRGPICYKQATGEEWGPRVGGGGGEALSLVELQ